MKTTTKFAIAAVAAALMGSTAIAADLGGSCCADLEERIAELEATTVRKGNRKVSVQLSGFVGHQVMWWDDGARSDFYIGDGGNIFSRWRLRGEAKISPDWTAGFLYEFGINSNAIGTMSQIMGNDAQAGANGDDLGAAGAPLLRDSTIWLRHRQLGMVKIGQGSTATDNLVLIDLGNRGIAGTPDIALYNGGFRIVRNDIISGGTGSGIAAVTWTNAILGGESYDTARRNHVLYETPSLHGFTVQAAVAEDNYWDIALRYAGEFNGVRVAFGIGYQENSEFNHIGQTPGVFPAPGFNSCTANDDCSRTEAQFKGSASILHLPTGLFLTGAWGTRDMENHTSMAVGGAAPPLRTVGVGPEAGNVNASSNFWHLSGGVSKNFFGIGNTVLFAEYTESNDALRHVFDDVTSSKMTQWGLGINQYIDAAGGMQLFATYKNFELDVTTTVAGGGTAKVNGLSDFSTFILGTRIDF